jgi:hypothetical protein
MRYVYLTLTVLGLLLARPAAASADNGRHASAPANKAYAAVNTATSASVVPVRGFVYYGYPYAWYPGYQTYYYPGSAYGYPYYYPRRIYPYNYYYGSPGVFYYNGPRVSFGFGF